MLQLQRNTTNVIIFSNNVNHDTTQPYKIVFKGLADNVIQTINNVANISASPSRFMMFQFNEPTDVQLKDQMYEVKVYDSTNQLVAYQLAKCGVNTVTNTMYNKTNTNIYYK
jgi:hypothetical protein